MSAVGIVQDITERKLAQEALRESRKMLRMIIDTIPVRVFWKNRDLKYLGCNIPFARDAGFENPDDLTGMDDYQMGWKDQADLYRKDDMEVIGMGKPKLDFEEPQTTPDGKTIWLKTSKLPLADINGNILGVLGTYEDITERKQMEGELIAARDKAEESDRLKTAFLNNLSHEIRTPLNAIVGFSELINKPGLSEGALRNYTDIVRRSSGQLLAIIDDIFDIAAIEAGQIKVYVKDFDIKTLLRVIHDQFSLRIAGKDIKLQLDISLSDEEAVIRNDETKVNQILNNLIGNAVKFTRKGKIEISCRKDTGEIIFCVKDSGIGIPADLHEKIFERFRQANIDANAEFGGNGLGLFIAKSYARLLGGRIWLKSEPGKGSEFYFTVRA